MSAKWTMHYAFVSKIYWIIDEWEKLFPAPKIWIQSHMSRVYEGNERERWAEGQRVDWMISLQDITIIHGNTSLIKKGRRREYALRNKLVWNTSQYLFGPPNYGIKFRMFPPHCYRAANRYQNISCFWNLSRFRPFRHIQNENRDEFQKQFIAQVCSLTTHPFVRVE